jgi:hypothetical protein
MQTFLPYADFRRTAAVLDDRRLGKQRVEVLQILNAINRPDHGWRQHPAVLMWADHVEALVAYGRAVVEEWRRRGYADTCGPKIDAYLPTARDQAALAEAGALPSWLGDEAFHRSHRSSLVRKDPSYYRERFPKVPDDLPYIWPVRGAAPALPHTDRPGFAGWLHRADRGRLAGAFVAAGVVGLDVAPRLDQDLSGLGRDELRALVAEAHPEAPPARRGGWSGQLDRLLNQVGQGHAVLLQVAGIADWLVGAVSGGYRWERDPAIAHYHHVRPVHWHGRLRRAVIPSGVRLGGPQTLSPLFDLDLGLLTEPL